MRATVTISLPAKLKKELDRETLRALKAARARIDREEEAIGVTRPPTAAADPASPQEAPDRGGSARSRSGA
jgi:hypothetical protein